MSWLARARRRWRTGRGRIKPGGEEIDPHREAQQESGLPQHVGQRVCHVEVLVRAPQVPRRPFDGAVNLQPEGRPADPHELLNASGGRPRDLSEALHDADPATKRAFFDAFDLRGTYDKLEGRLQISATITEALADLLEEPGDLALCGVYSGGGTRTHNQSVNSRLLCH
jgi:hypothetical protein